MSLRGAAKPSLLDTYAIERELADHHALEVTNEIHNSIVNLVAMCAEGKKPSLPAEGPALALAGLRKRSMLDVSYAGSPSMDPQSEVPGRALSRWSGLTGVSHHLVVFGGAPPLDDFRARWGALVSVVEWPPGGARPAQAGLAEGGLVLVRPDGFIGFRRASADEAAMKSLDTHLSTYLQPNFAPVGEFAAGGR